MKRIFITTVLILFSVSLPAQDVASQILRQVTAIRSGQSAEYGAADRITARRPEAVIRELEAYRTDAVPEVRQWIYEQYHLVLRMHDRPQSMRHEAVSLLVEGIADPQPAIRNDCVEYLTSCSRSDFSPQARERFTELFTGKHWFSRNLILLAGFIGSESCKPALEEIAYSPAPEQRRLQWHAHLALARMGDGGAVNWCLLQINRAGVNDNVVYDLLPGLVYTRHPRMFEFLVSVLMSDEKLCTSSNPDSGANILCGYRVMEYLAPVIKGYPLKLHPSGDIDTDDYHRALLTVRNWFAERNGNYEILTDTF
jgi:hypothetical protein